MKQDFMDISESHSASALSSEIVQKLKDRNIAEYPSDLLEKADSAGPGGWGGRASIYWKNLGDGQFVAIKCLSKSFEKRVTDADGQPDEESRKKKLFQYFERECILWHLGSRERDDPRSSKIVRLLGFTRSYDRSIYPSLVLELYREGDLRDFVSNHRTLSEKVRVRLLLDAASGLAYLHDPRLMIVHRDIKGRNIMVRREPDGTLSAAIGDFGSAKLLESQEFSIQNSSFTQSLHWTPPDYIVSGREDYSKPTIFGDIWSFGCTILEIMSNSTPWDGISNIVPHLSGELPLRHPPRPRSFRRDSLYWTLACSCFQLQPEQRPTGRILEWELQRIYNNLQ